MRRKTDNRGRVTTARPRRIQIQMQSATPSAVDGSLTPAWTTIGSATTVDWRTGGGRIEYLADEPRPEDDAVIRIRWRSDLEDLNGNPTEVTAGMRVLVTGPLGTAHAYDIDAVIDVANQHQYWDLYVRRAGV